ncbi:MAG TPA: SDR family NAD(P)-dependent oxidoreductase [Rugosimonospora sp.]|nr:SDR family NAD(P)-dependent oxidoreductase [Rugosimonospora sp.]
MGDFTGRTVVVTGANSGVGLAGALGFARLGARVALVGRDENRLAQAVAAVRELAGPDAEPAGYRCDFSVLDEVRALAERLGAAYPKIDVLANNAGAVGHQRVTTVDGHEQTIQANHLSPFLLTNLLRERLAGGRVVNTASDAHRSGRLDPADLESNRHPYRALRVYGSSKQANILFAAEAARRWPEILSFSYHPGVVRSNFGRDSAVYRFFYRFAPMLTTPEGGADTMLWLAGTPAAELTDGGYYVKRQLRRPSPPTGDAAFAAKLWEVSAAAVGLTPATA